VSKKYRFLDERKFRNFCQGLTLDATDMGVLDGALVGLDAQNKIPSRIVTHSQHHGFGPGLQLPGGQIILTLEKRGGPEKGPLSIAYAVRHKEILNKPPALHIMLRSISLDILQRVEIPLRYVLKGLPDIEGTYMVYLHVLKMEGGEELVYYGVTKRGWMKRFDEHMQHAMRVESPLLFHRMLRDGIRGRLHQLHGPGATSEEAAPTHVMVANHHVVCGAGLSEEKALESEEYLVEKYSFGKPSGLNMIPGGKAGIAYLHRLTRPSPTRSLTTDQDRERVLEQYLRAHPRKGLPNPTIVERWKDDEYAARIICSGGRRLTRDQVAQIRAAAASGIAVEKIGASVGARNEAQVARVIEGKTYRRIR
jgi:hypothetical protein